MPDFITLSCPSCGGKLEVTNDLERFACAYCGIEQIVRRTASTVSLEPIARAVEKISVGVDKTASELAIPRLEKEIQEHRIQRDILFQEKGKQSAVRQWDLSCSHWGMAILRTFIIIVSLVVSLTGFLCSNLGLGVFFLLLALVIIGISVSVSSRYHKAKDELIRAEAARPHPKSTQIAELDNQIQHKEDQLATHRELVAR